MTLNRGLFTSASDKWATPMDVYEALNAEFGTFTLDPCATAETAKCADWYGEDGLDRPWCGRVFVNPPYGRVIGEWVAKCHLAAKEGEAAIVVALLPSRTDTRWWHEHVMEADEIRFLKGRLHFSGHQNGAPFPSAVVVWQGFP